AQSVNERAWSMASAPSAPSMPCQRVVHSMEGSPNDAVLLLTSNTYQASGGQQRAMVIREVCPECKSARYKKNGHLHKPTVSLDVISLVASSCGYYRGHIEQRAAHEFAMHVATRRGLAERPQHRHPPRAQPVAPLRERHCRRPRLTPSRCTDQAPSRDQGHPGG